MLFIKTWERMILREKNVCTIVCIHFKLYRRIDIMIHDFSHIQAAVASGVWGGGRVGGGWQGGLLSPLRAELRCNLRLKVQPA